MASSIYKDVKVPVHPDIAKEFWKKRHKVSNFLKHANLDANSHISIEEVDNLFLLMFAQGSYFNLTGRNLGTEGYVLYIYSAVDFGIIEGLPVELQKIVRELEHLSCSERRAPEILFRSIERVEGIIL